ncbi:MAG: tRNA uridine-5-carboxymethylaminomethyl(34) synthesis GTPase MnmE, partial [Paludibacteraceae bacterium]|nr:tRNA uridine-5-carboxymethylaminomethyl(34) synthesis GTPase MnmE [Paludibacteraceae bacterium]
MERFNTTADTICAISTAPGMGAIAIIRLSGDEAIHIADKLFVSAKKGKRLADAPSHTAHFGTIRNDNGEIVDEVVATLYIAPHSFTGENSVEIACHGSTFIQQRIIQLLLEKGCRMAQPGEFTQRAFLNGKMDLSQAEAVADVIASNSS